MITEKEIIESKAFKSAMSNAKNVLIEQFELAAPDDTEALSQIAYKLDALRRVESELIIAMSAKEQRPRG